MKKHFPGLESLPFKISDNFRLQEKKFGISHSARQLLEELYFEVGKGKKSTIKRLKRAVKKYPKVPQFKNYLSKEYLAANDEKKADEVAEWTLETHPDYLFGKLNKAHSLMQKEKTELVPEILGEELELHALYPERDEFHIDEVLNFYSTTVFYFLETGDREQAAARLRMLEELDPLSQATQLARNRLMMFDINANVEKSRQTWEHDQKHERIVQSRDYRKSTQTDQKPEFHHSEIEYLYTNGFDISKQKVREILDLPKETLVNDLEAVLEDAVNRHEVLKAEILQNDWREDRHNFGLHAVFLLAEMNSTRSLPSVLDLLRQGDEFIDFWYADRLEEFFSAPVAALAENNLHLLDEFLKEPDNSYYARNIAVTAAEKIALQKPERREAVINLYEEWIRFMLGNEQDDSLFDTNLLGFIVWSCIDVKAERLLPLIKQLYEMNMVPITIAGTYEEVERDMLKNKSFQTSEPFDIYTYYKQIHTHPMYGSNDLEAADLQPPQASLPPLSSFDQPAVNPWKDVGRNDPCPCGSGRKYKKCCLR